MNDCWNTIGVRGNGSCQELKQHAHCDHCPVHAEAAAQLLERIPPDGYIAGWTTHFAQPAQDGERRTEPAVLFRLGAEWFALPAAVVEEIADMKPIHSIPHRGTRAVVVGITNVRGELVVCASLAAVLGVESMAPDAAKAASATRRLLVLRRDDVRAACPVDEVGGVIRFDPRELMDVPGTLGRAASHYSKQLLSWGNRSVGVLDDQLLCYALKRSLG